MDGQRSPPVQIETNRSFAGEEGKETGQHKPFFLFLLVEGLIPFGISFFYFLGKGRWGGGVAGGFLILGFFGFGFGFDQIIRINPVSQ